METKMSRYSKHLAQSDGMVYRKTSSQDIEKH